MAVAVLGARRRIIGLSSPVATTVMVLSRCPAMVSSSISRTSRPRSPVKASTTVSKSAARVIMARRVDLPTPDPAKMPIRWPKQSGVKISMILTPVRKPRSTRPRRKAAGARLSDAIGRVPGCNAPFPSTACPSALMTRPRHSGAGRIRSGPSSKTAAPSEGMMRSSKGFTSTCVSATRMISARLWPPCAWIATASPKRASRESPRTAIAERDTSLTVPPIPVNGFGATDC